MSDTLIAVAVVILLVWTAKRLWVAYDRRYWERMCRDNNIGPLFSGANAEAPLNIVARADQQHAAILRGDLRLGVYGAYPPASLT